MGPECDCGCGERLPEGSTRRYKNGHRPLYEAAPDLSEISDVTENDPDPLEPDAAPGPEPIRITKRVEREIEGKLAWMLSMTGTVWGMSDPLCAGTLLERAPDIAAKLTPVICQSQAAVRWFRKSSNAAMYIDLLMACMPVITAVYAHHMARPADGQVPPDAHLPGMPAYAADGAR